MRALAIALAILTVSCRDARIDVTAAHVSDLQRRVGELEAQVRELREALRALQPPAAQ